MTKSTAGPFKGNTHAKEMQFRLTYTEVAVINYRMILVFFSMSSIESTSSSRIIFWSPTPLTVTPTWKFCYFVVSFLRPLAVFESETNVYSTDLDL